MHETGTGFGLTVCKKLVDKLQGEISLHSLENVGTKVEVRVPVEVSSEMEGRVLSFDTGDGPHTAYKKDGRFFG